MLVCPAMQYSSGCREGEQPGFSVQRWLLAFPQGKHVLTGGCVSQHAYHGYAQSGGSCSTRPGSRIFRGFPECWDGAQAQLKAVWLHCPRALEPCSNSNVCLPKTLFQKEIKELGWKGRSKQPYSSEQGHCLPRFDSSFVQRNKTLCVPCNLAWLLWW